MRFIKNYFIFFVLWITSSLLLLTNGSIQSSNNFLTSVTLKNNSINNESTSFIEFYNENSLICPMYTEKCYFVIRIPSLNINDIKITSQNINLMNFLSYENKFDQKNDYLVHIEPILIGKTFIQFKTNKFSHSILKKVVVTRPERCVDILHQIYILFFSVMIALLMGTMLDWEIIKNIIKVPIPVAIGFSAQYILMPLLTFSFIHIFELKAAEALALFIYGSSPGGTVSNNWTIIFNGDLDLSAILTFFSTMSSLVMLPLWFYTLGSTLSQNANIQIPIDKLVMNLFLTIIPSLIGMALAHKFPIIKEKVSKIIKHLVIFLNVTFFTFTVYAKFYIFKLMIWHQWFAGPLLPWSGFLFGGILAWIAKLPNKQVYTISIETGLQNIGVAFLIIMLNFPSPEADYALLPLIAVTALTTIPLWILLMCKIAKHWYNRLFVISNADKNEKNEGMIKEVMEKTNFILIEGNNDVKRDQHL